jgi:hypothetical protein
MDHQEQQHHQHHQKEREHEKKEEKAREREAEKSALPFHPAWFVAVGVVAILMVLGVWLFLTIP